MSTTWGIAKGLLGVLKYDFSAFAENSPGSRTLHDPYFGEHNAFFKVYTGLDHDGFTNAGGDLPDARLFDYNGKHCGQVMDPGVWVAPGSSAVFWAGTRAQPVYTLFTGNYDAQCIAFVTTTWPGMTGHFGWVGDWASECVGNDTTVATWYFSKVAVPGTAHFPNCLWIDLDGGAPATGFQVNWVDMLPSDNDTRIGKTAKDMCQTPSFQIYQHHEPSTIIYHEMVNEKQGSPQPPVVKRSEPAPPRPRSQPKRSVSEAKLAFENKYGNMLVIDDLPSHDAHSLCESATSAGPSFVNPEHGYFCDMQTKKIYPVCGPRNGKFACFEMEQKQLGKST